MEPTTESLPHLLADARFAMVTVATAAGLDARPLTIQRTDERSVWFLVSDETSWLPDLTGPVNVSVSEDKLWVSLSGSCQLLTDPATLDDLGDPISDAWFQEGQRPVALRFDVERGEWWSSPGFVRTALGVALAKVTGHTPSAGESGSVS